MDTGNLDVHSLACTETCHMVKSVSFSRCRLGTRKKLTVLLLSPARCAIGAVWSLRNVRVEKTFLSLADPPVL